MDSPAGDVNHALNYVVATILGVIAVAGAAVVCLVVAQRHQAKEQAKAKEATQVDEFRGDSLVHPPLRRKNPLLDAVSPPAPHHRTSIDLLRRRYRQGGQVSDQASASGSDTITKAAAATSEAAQHSPLDTMELDTDTVAVLDCMAVNRILNCVPPDELEKHRLVLDSFNWDLDVLLETEIMTGITED
ncbi:hypothetical protein PLESTB_001042700 [Pleodorina starrii]|uniref:Uncharacterized protein n=1 Tax=Pleodorina starrii TaxID=330485 RepID=A0A9W6F509_9CHLO|nr:hypothetical protein PLESTB_001042700 [Pleodorina starrii]